MARNVLVAEDPTRARLTRLAADFASLAAEATVRRQGDTLSLFDLFRAPQRYISEHLDAAPHHWLIPLGGYTALSLSEGHHRMVERLPGSPPAVVLVAALAFAATLGCCLWALSYGGALHLGARVLGGKPGLSPSIQAVGYALFWPGLLGAGCAVAMSHSSGPLVYPFLAGNLLGGGWGLYTVLGALRARHSFSWGRAVATWALTLTAIVLIGLLFLALLSRIVAV